MSKQVKCTIAVEIQYIFLNVVAHFDGCFFTFMASKYVNPFMVFMIENY